jgi:hypothetical protein
MPTTTPRSLRELVDQVSNELERERVVLDQLQRA